jgi:ABC-type Mn2+/Zn2+ transport system ATPase subunit
MSNLHASSVATTVDTSVDNVSRQRGFSQAGQVAALDEAGVRYGDIQALAPSTLSFEAGTTVALVGSNGSGKSTLLGLLADLISPSEGTVTHRPGLRVSFVAQQHHHHRWMPLTVNEVVRMGCFGKVGLLGRIGKTQRAAGEEVARRLEITNLMRRSYGELSGGQRQRVLMAQALVAAPDLLLLDEPITGLDLASQATILRVIAEESQRGATVVFSTHHLDEARRADRVILLAGQVVADGVPADALRPELLARAFAGRVLQVDGSTVVMDDHGHGDRHEDCDHLDPGASAGA